jgi:hypothetical protein
MKTLIGLTLLCAACATTNTVKPTPAPIMVGFDEVKEGIRADCVKPPNSYWGLDLMESVCRYNIDKAKPAACVYMGKKLLPPNTIFVCGALLSAPDCYSKWEPITIQCTILPTKQGE